jgi:outer membrane lipoprotein-sorting protein
MKHPSRLATLLAAICWSTSAFAGAGDDLLAKVERALGNFEDSTINFTVLNLKPGTTQPVTLEFIARVKGKKSMTEFLAPGDLKGTRVLALSPTELYVYLPEFQKIRRVTSSSTEQGFMGTVLTQQDMAPAAYTSLFTVSNYEDKGATAVLTLKAREGIDIQYKTMIMTVDKAKSVPTKMDYLSDAGAVVRTETRESYTCNPSGYCMFGGMTMVDHARGGAWTQLRPTSIQLNTGLSDEIFTQRTLQYGL